MSPGASAMEIIPNGYLGSVSRAPVGLSSLGKMSLGRKVGVTEKRAGTTSAPDVHMRAKPARLCASKFRA